MESKIRGEQERERERETRKMTKNATKFSREVRIHVIFPLKGTRHLLWKFQRLLNYPNILTTTYIQDTFHFVLVFLLSLFFFFLCNEGVIKICSLLENVTALEIFLARSSMKFTEENASRLVFMYCVVFTTFL